MVAGAAWILGGQGTAWVAQAAPAHLGQGACQPAPPRVLSGLTFHLLPASWLSQGRSSPAGQEGPCPRLLPWLPGLSSPSAGTQVDPLSCPHPHGSSDEIGLVWEETVGREAGAELVAASLMPRGWVSRALPSGEHQGGKGPLSPATPLFLLPFLTSFREGLPLPLTLSLPI